MGRVGFQYQINGVTVGPFEFNQAESGAATSWTWDAYDEVYLGTGDSVMPMVFQSNTAAVSSSLTWPSSLEVTWWSK
jgi:hypothetical protein